MVLTGGAGQLPGLTELAGTILNKQVRTGRPIGMDGLAEAASGPAFSTCVGLLNYALSEKHHLSRNPFKEETLRADGRLGRLGHWLKENF
jgi:cell division protein FtsA